MASNQAQKPVAPAGGQDQIVIGSINLDNIQGDIVAGLPKKAEIFFFFQITDVTKFRSGLSKLIPHIASTTDVTQAREDIVKKKMADKNCSLNLNFLNISFAAKGLQKLGIKDDVKDDVFVQGQLSDAKSLGDPGQIHGKDFEPDWIYPFKHEIHGVLLVAGATNQSVQFHLDAALAVLVGSVREVYKIVGNVRPGPEDGHEHFGFNDGISQPAIKGVTTGQPGDDEVKPGVILVGRDGDPETGRPAWTTDGSFLTFRLLNQLVPEFNKFLVDNAIKSSDPTVPGSDLLGARLVGRWKSGAPIQLAPLKDNPVLAADPTKRNDFDFDPQTQEKCPFAAHIRKSYPRKDLDEDTQDAPHRILRRGIAFGPELTPSEKAQSKTEQDRGLLFVSYQSSVKMGFQFIQKNWVNNPNFPPKAPVVPGFDPIIGQSPTGIPRTMNGFDPKNAVSNLSLGMQQWVLPRGGEYFFSPSLSALKTVFAAGGK